jgi:hypothetical protein
VKESDAERQKKKKRVMRNEKEKGGERQHGIRRKQKGREER